MSEFTYIRDTATDSAGNLYVCGSINTGSDPASMHYDAVLAKYDPNGNFLWMVQLDSSPAGQSDGFKGIELDAEGNIYLIGSVSEDGVFGTDPFWAKYDSDGIFLCLNQLVTPINHVYDDIGVDDATGSVYVTGYAISASGNASNGQSDSFLIRYDPIPEPATMSLLAIAGLAVLRRRKK